MPQKVAPEPKVTFYDLSGPHPWSPYCWRTRFVLNFKALPYQTVKLSYPAIRGTCERLFGEDLDAGNIEATVPIIEILSPPAPTYKALNDSGRIATLLNSTFTPKDGIPHLEGVDTIAEWEEKTKGLGKGIIRWVLYDVWVNALDKEDGSREFFKSTREADAKCDLKDVMDVKGRGEEKVLGDIKTAWLPLQSRMKNEDGTGEPTYWDFCDAAYYKWVEAANPEKAERLKGIYGDRDETFVKLLRKVGRYAY